MEGEVGSQGIVKKGMTAVAKRGKQTTGGTRPLIHVERARGGKA